MARSTIIIINAVAVGFMATMAGASTPSSPAEKAATAALNRKITGDNAAEEARFRTQQDAYDKQVKTQQVQYDEEQKRTYEAQKAYEQQVTQQKVQYEQQIQSYEQQKAQYEQALKNAQFNAEKQP